MYGLGAFCFWDGKVHAAFLNFLSMIDTGNIARWALARFSGFKLSWCAMYDGIKQSRGNWQSTEVSRLRRTYCPSKFADAWDLRKGLRMNAPSFDCCQRPCNAIPFQRKEKPGNGNTLAIIPASPTVYFSSWLLWNQDFQIFVTWRTLISRISYEQSIFKRKVLWYSIRVWYSSSFYPWTL